MLKLTLKEEPRQFSLYLGNKELARLRVFDDQYIEIDGESCSDMNYPYGDDWRHVVEKVLVHLGYWFRYHRFPRNCIDEITTVTIPSKRIR